MHILIREYLPLASVYPSSRSNSGRYDQKKNITVVLSEYESFVDFLCQLELVVGCPALRILANLSKPRKKQTLNELRIRFSAMPLWNFAATGMLMRHITKCECSENSFLPHLTDKSITRHGRYFEGSRLSIQVQSPFPRH